MKLRPPVYLSARFRLFFAFTIVIAMTLSTLSCSTGASVTQAPASPTPSGQTPSAATASSPTAALATASTPAGYSFPVILNDKQIALFTVADLAKLPQVKATVGGTEEQGPTLLSVLNLAGVTDFTEVTIDGFTKGRLATAELTLNKAEVTDNVMLALVSRGSAKLTGTDIGAQKAIIDVSKISVK